MKFLLYGDGEHEATAENTQKLTELLFSSGVLLQTLENMKEFEFEARKDVAQVYNYVLRQQKTQAIEYMKGHTEILKMLVNGYSEPEIALNCGSILREVIRHEALNEMLLNSPLFEAFFEYVQLSTFDVASDAFATFKLMLTKHKVQCAKFLEANFDKVFGKYNVLLQSRNYVTKRQSLKLLGELLLNQSNFNIMMKYINDPNNLKIMMNLLRGNTKAIQFEAFHVFKIFVANPKKSKPVVEILVRNRKKLIEFLKKFQKDKEDEQFNDEKGILLATLEKLDDSILSEGGKDDGKTDDPKKA
jgi:calcium binding protein 39